MSDIVYLGDRKEGGLRFVIFAINTVRYVYSMDAATSSRVRAIAEKAPGRALNIAKQWGHLEESYSIDEEIAKARSKLERHK